MDSLHWYSLWHEPLWQVGDGAQQSRAFKMALKKAKQHIIKEKTKICLPCKIEKHDNIGLVHCAWNESFQNVESNKTAIQERGWGPLTFNLLDHPELKKEKMNNAVSDAYDCCSLQGFWLLALEDLNMTDRLTRILLDKIIDQKCHERARNEALQQQTNNLLERSKEQFTTAV